MKKQTNNTTGSNTAKAVNNGNKRKEKSTMTKTTQTTNAAYPFVKSVKTELGLTISDTKTTFQAINHTKYIDLDSDGNEKVRNKRNKITNPCGTVYKHITEKGTDYFSAVVQYLAPKFAYTTLRTIYSHSAHDMIRRLMIDCTVYAHKNNTVSNEFEMYISDADAVNILDYVTPSKNTKTDTKKKEKAVRDAHEHKTVDTHEHTYTMYTDDDGKRHKIEIIPKTSFTFTEYGKAITNQDTFEPSLTAEDVIQTAAQAIITLYRFGLVNSVYELFQYSTYIYKVCNAFVLSERANQIHTTAFETINDDGETVYITEPQIDDIAKEIDKSAVLDMFVDMLTERLDKRCNVENVLAFFDMVYIKSETWNNTAAALKVSEVVLNKYNTYILRALNNPETHETLHNLI